MNTYTYSDWTDNFKISWNICLKYFVTFLSEVHCCHVHMGLFLKHLNVTAHNSEVHWFHSKRQLPPPNTEVNVSVLKPEDIPLICFPAYSARVSAVEILWSNPKKKLILLYPIKGKSVHLPDKAGCHGKVPSSGMNKGGKLSSAKRGTEYKSFRRLPQGPIYSKLVCQACWKGNFLFAPHHDKGGQRNNRKRENLPDLKLCPSTWLQHWD